MKRASPEVPIFRNLIWGPLPGSSSSNLMEENVPSNPKGYLVSLGVGVQGSFIQEGLLKQITPQCTTHPQVSWSSSIPVFLNSQWEWPVSFTGNSQWASPMESDLLLYPQYTAHKDDWGVFLMDGWEEGWMKGGWVGGWMTETDLRWDAYVSLCSNSRVLLFSLFKHLVDLLRKFPLITYCIPDSLPVSTCCIPMSI